MSLFLCIVFARSVYTLLVLCTTRAVSYSRT